MLVRAQGTADVSDPRVSIVVPVYNCERFIGEALGSALAQTYADLEVVVVDNSSTDRTAEVIARWKDPRLRVLANATNIGAARNWDRAAAEARGRYIKLLCADDVLYPKIGRAHV